PAMINMPRFAAVLAAACFIATPAFADPYKVRDLNVDMVAPTAAEARLQGNAAARLAGAQRLIERLTLPEDRAAARQPIDVNVVASTLYKSSTTQQEFKTFPVSGGVRVTGVVEWEFLPRDVREYLDARGVPY